MNKPSMTELKSMTIAEIQARAEVEGIRLPKNKRKADQIQLFLDLLESKSAAPEVASDSTSITLDCGHPFEVEHINVFPENVKAYLAKAKKEAVCPRCPSDAPEPTPKATVPPKPAKAAPAIEEAPAPTPGKAQKSPGNSEPKAPKPKKAAKAPEYKKEPQGWGFSSKEGGHADASKRLIRAKTVEAKAEIAAELMEATGWSTKTPNSPLIVEAYYGDASIAIEYPEDGIELIPGHPKSPLIRLWKSSAHKGAKLPNVSAAVRAANALMEKLAETTNEDPPVGAESKAATSANADPVAA